MFIPISPTRVLDTRIAAGLPSALTNSVPALLDVTGNIPIVSTDQTIGSAVVVPDGATSIVANGPQTPNTLDESGDTGSPSITIGTDGNPIISYFYNTSGDLRLVACTNTTCAGPQTPVTLDSAGNAGLSSSITIGTNGNPVISYQESSNSDLRVITCGNPTCQNYRGRGR